MVKINEEQLMTYFKKHRYSTYDKVAGNFCVSTSLIRKKFIKEIISSLNFRSKYITHVNIHSFDSNGLLKIDDILFSRYRNIKETLLHIIDSKDCISSNDLYPLFGFNVRQQISQLIKERKVFTKKEAKHSLYALKPFQEEMIREKEFDISSLKKDDKVLKHLQIIKELRDLKKIDVARKHNTSTETIRNIESRFNKDGTKGLIHTRESKTVKVSSAKQAAIITEVAKHPKKTAKEIKKSLTELGSIPLKTIKATIKDVKSHLEAKKKLLLEIQ